MQRDSGKMLSPSERDRERQWGRLENTKPELASRESCFGVSCSMSVGKTAPPVLCCLPVTGTSLLRLPEGPRSRVTNSPWKPHLKTIDSESFLTRKSLGACVTIIALSTWNLGVNGCSILPEVIYQLLRPHHFLLSHFQGMPPCCLPHWQSY